MHNSINKRLSHDELSIFEEDDSGNKESVVKKRFDHLTSDEHAYLLSEFVCGIREEYQGEASVDDVEFTDLLNGIISVTFFTYTNAGCKDASGADMQSEDVHFSINLELSEINFETNPENSITDRYDEI